VPGVQPQGQAAIQQDLAETVMHEEQRRLAAGAWPDQQGCCDRCLGRLGRRRRRGRGNGWGRGLGTRLLAGAAGRRAGTGFRVTRVVQGRGQGANRRRREPCGQRQRDAEILLHAREEPHGDQRIAAQFEEVIEHADLGHPQQLGPDRGERDFERALGPDIVAAQRGPGEVRRRFACFGAAQALRIELEFSEPDIDVHRRCNHLGHLRLCQRPVEGHHAFGLGDGFAQQRFHGRIQLGFGRRGRCRGGLRDGHPAVDAPHREALDRHQFASVGVEQVDVEARHAGGSAGAQPHVARGGPADGGEDPDPGVAERHIQIGRTNCTNTKSSFKK